MAKLNPTLAVSVVGGWKTSEDVLYKIISWCCEIVCVCISAYKAKPVVSILPKENKQCSLENQSLSLLVHQWGMEGVCFKAENCTKKFFGYLMLWLV